MREKLWIYISLLVIVPGLLFTVSCGKKVVQSEPTAEEAAAVVEEPAATDAAPDDADLAAQEQAAQEEAAQEEAARQWEMKAEEDIKQAQIAEQAAKDEEIERAKVAAMMMFMSEDIYFSFDSARLGEMAKNLLSRKADWLHTNPDASVIIEGHCDERGTNAFNIALGDRRAESVKAFFVEIGIDATQLSTISYGEERPVDGGKNESAWIQNRRAHFVIE